GEDGLAAAARDVADAGGTPLPLVVDTADFTGMAGAAEHIEATLGPIDVWVNNAFTSVFAPFTEIGPDEFRRITEVTYLGCVYGTRIALGRMLPRDRGAIVQVGSALAYRGIPLQSAYCGAKHAIQGFTESVRCELLHDGSRVRLTMVQLPALNTPQFDWVLTRLRRHARPVPPVYQPEVAARAIVYAAGHPGRREYWVGGSTVSTLLANAVAPGLLDRYLARTGYAAQEGDRPAPGGPGNLWQPADGAGEPDYGAHGSVDGHARQHSAQLWASEHHRLLATGAGTVLGLGLAAVAAVARRAGR
ncbi:MAG: SDR family oxidoreductase, partial [Micromonosporaceae bacterium]|nr:SDR family oxidoreductase [Micromonosporaceae bacterium]